MHEHRLNRDRDAARKVQPRTVCSMTRLRNQSLVGSMHEPSSLLSHAGARDNLKHTRNDTRRSREAVPGGLNARMIPVSPPQGSVHPLKKWNAECAQQRR